VHATARSSAAGYRCDRLAHRSAPADERGDRPGHRLSRQRVGGRVAAGPVRREWPYSPGLERDRLHRGQEHRHRVSLGRLPLRSLAGTGGGTRPKGHRGPRRARRGGRGEGRDGGDPHHSHRLHDRLRSGRERAGIELQPSRRKRHRRGLSQRAARAETTPAAARGGSRGGRRSRRNRRPKNCRRRRRWVCNCAWPR